MKYFWVRFDFEPWLYVCGWKESKEKLKWLWKYHADFYLEDTDPDWTWTLELPEFYSTGVTNICRRIYPSIKQNRKHIKHIINTYRGATLKLIGTDYGIDAIEHSSDFRLYMTPQEAFAQGRRSLHKKLMRDRESKVRKDRRH